MSANEEATKAKTREAIMGVFMATSVNSFSVGKATFEIYSRFGGAVGAPFERRFVTTREIVMVLARITRMTRSEIQFGIGNRRATIIFVPTKKRISASPVLR